MNKRIMVDCGRCRGTGKIPFTGVYAKTLRLLDAQEKPINGADLAAKFGCAPSAMCNRLIALEALGLASAICFGHEKLWTSIAKN